MKILHIFDFFSPTHGGGTVDLLYRIARGQSDQGHDVSIYTSDFELDQSFIDSLPGVEVIPFHSWLKIGSMHVTPGLISEVRKNLQQFDIIHLHCYRSFQNIIIHHYAKKYGIPYVLDGHGSTPRIAAGRMSPMVFFKWLYDIFFGYRIMKDADRLVADTGVGISEFVDIGADESSISLIHPPLDVGEFDELPSAGTFRNRYHIGSPKLVIFLGRINWIKGLDFLVEVFAELMKQRGDVSLVIVGPDDGHKKHIEKRIKQLKIKDKVLFTGFLTGKEKLAALVDADVLVQPSIYEQGARVSLEAIMCHTPVIVSKNTGAGEDIENMDGGSVVEYGDTEAFITAVNDALDNPAEAQAKTQKARQYIKANLSVASQTGKYQEVYLKAIVEKSKLVESGQ